MKQELSATIVWSVIGVAVVVVAVVIYLGTMRGGSSSGEVVKPKPWSPAGYGRATPGAPGRAPGAPAGAPPTEAAKSGQ